MRHAGGLHGHAVDSGCLARRRGLAEVGVGAAGLAPAGLAEDRTVDAIIGRAVVRAAVVLEHQRAAGGGAVG